jgi:hypothetical protein
MMFHCFDRVSLILNIVLGAQDDGNPLISLLIWTSLIGLAPFLMAMLGAILRRVHSHFRDPGIASKSEWFEETRASRTRHSLTWREDTSRWEPERWGR